MGVFVFAGGGAAALHFLRDPPRQAPRPYVSSIPQGLTRTQAAPPPPLPTSDPPDAAARPPDEATSAPPARAAAASAGEWRASPKRAGFSLVLEWDPQIARADQQASYAETLRAAVLEAYAAMAAALDRRWEKPLVVHVYTPVGFRQRFGSGVGNNYGALYGGGAIHTNGGRAIDVYFRATLRHELVHALFDSDGQGHRLPAWLNEGVACTFGQRLLGEASLTANQIQELQRAQQNGGLPALPTSGWFTPFQYVHATGAVQYLMSKNAGGLGRAIGGILSGQSVDEAFRRELRMSPAEVERGLASWLRSLSPIREATPQQLSHDPGRTGVSLDSVTVKP